MFIIQENIRMDLKIGIITRNWVESAQGRGYWRAPLNEALNLRVSWDMKLLIVSYSSLYVGILYNLNSRENFEPGPEFEPQTSRSLAWRSVTWAIHFNWWYRSKSPSWKQCYSGVILYCISEESLLFKYFYLQYIPFVFLPSYIFFCPDS